MYLSKENMKFVLAGELIVCVGFLIFAGLWVYGKMGEASAIVNAPENVKYCLVSSGMIGDSVSFASTKQQGELLVVARPDGGVEILEKCAE